MAAMNIANQAPPQISAPVFTPSTLAHYQPVAPPPMMPTMPMMPTQQPPPMLHQTNPVPTFAPNLPTVMSTSVGTYQAATLVVTESPTVPIANPISNSYVSVATPIAGHQYQTSPVVVNGNRSTPSPTQHALNGVGGGAAVTSNVVEARPQPNDPNVILAKPVPLLTDITLNATPTMLPADQSVQMT